MGQCGADNDWLKKERVYCNENFILDPRDRISAGGLLYEYCFLVR